MNTCDKYFMLAVIEFYESKLLAILTDVLSIELRTKQIDTIVSRIKDKLKKDGLDNCARCIIILWHTYCIANSFCSYKKIIPKRIYYHFFIMYFLRTKIILIFKINKRITFIKH